MKAIENNIRALTLRLRDLGYKRQTKKVREEISETIKKLSLLIAEQNAK